MPDIRKTFKLGFWKLLVSGHPELTNYGDCKTSSDILIWGHFSRLLSSLVDLPGMRRFLLYWLGLDVFKGMGITSFHSLWPGSLLCISCLVSHMEGNYRHLKPLVLSRSIIPESTFLGLNLLWNLEYKCVSWYSQEGLQQHPWIRHSISTAKGVNIYIYWEKWGI